MRVFKRASFWVAFCALLLLSTCTHSSLSYSALCARCLQHQHGVEYSILGLRYSHHEWLSQGVGGLMSPAIFSPHIAPVDPHIYDEIFGRPCQHSFIRAGFCRSSFGVTGCGAFGGSDQYGVREALIENLYGAWRRIPDRELARATYAYIEELSPIVTGQSRLELSPTFLQFEAQRPDSSLGILMRGLPLVTTEAEWAKLLRDARQGNGDTGLLQDIPLLAARLQFKDPIVRAQVVDQLASLDQPEAWEVIATVLRDDDIGGKAMDHILDARKFPLFEKVLQARIPGFVDGSTDFFVDESTDVWQPFAGVASRLKDLSDAEVRSLFGHYGPLVNNLCVSIIRQGNRIDFLEQLLEYLNRSQWPGYVPAIESLLKGPDPFTQIDPKTRQPAEDPWRTILALRGRSASAGHPRTNQLIQEAITLGAQPDPAHWPKLRDVYRGWLTEGGNVWDAAAFAQAMAASDPARTADFLDAELTRFDGDDSSRAAALAGMGILANPANLPALEATAKPAAGRLFVNPSYYGIYYRYAVHRCRRLHLWRLSRNADGTYVLLKPE